VTVRPSLALLGHRSFRWFVVLYVLALAVRLAYFAQVRHNPLYDWPTLDENTNHQVALAVLKGTDPPKAYLKAPLHMYYLVGVYRLFGPQPDTARLIAVFLASLWAPLTFLIAERLFGRPTDIVAGVIAAFFWTFVFFSTELLDVGIAGVFYLLTACLAIRLPDNYRWKWMLTGLSLGLGAITRPNILIVAPLLAMAILIITLKRKREQGTTGAGIARPTAEAAGHPFLPETRDPRPETHRPSSPEPRTPNPEPRFQAYRLALTSIASLTVGCAAIILPVTLRNRVVGGEWVLIAAYGGVNFYLANNPESDAKNVELLGLPNYTPSNEYDSNDPYNVHCFTYREGCDYTQQKLGRPCTRGEMSDMMMSLGRAYIREHPAKFAMDSFKRLCWLFNAYEFADNKDLYQFCGFSPLLRGLSLFHYGILCPLIVLGLVLALWKKTGRERFSIAARGDARPPIAEEAADSFSSFTYYLTILAGLIGPGVFFLVNARFRAVIVCLLVPLGAYGLVRAVSWCRRSVERRKTFLAAAILAPVAVFSNSNVFDYRPPCHPYLMFIYAAACGATGRQEEMARTIERIERSTAMEVKGGGHGRALYCLFDYYDEKGPIEKAVYYGQQLIAKNQLDPSSAKRVFLAFMRADRRDLARQLLTLMNKGFTGADRAFVAAAMFDYGRKYHDREVLMEAAKIYRDLATQYPSELEHYRRIETIDWLLAAPTSTRAVGRSPASQP
jgi:hypothetical protein